jgi:hypothetical protein
MQHAEKELQNAVVKHPTKEPVAERNGTQPITMPEAEAFSGNLHKGRLGHPYHPQFLKISVCPHIMVPLREIHLHSPVHQRDKGTKHTYISLRDDMLVFIPEIPYVTKKIKGIRILRQRIQKIRKTPLPVSRILDIKTQMHVRYKICQPALHHAKMNMQRAAIRQ